MKSFVLSMLALSFVACAGAPKSSTPSESPRSAASESESLSRAEADILKSIPKKKIERDKGTLTLTFKNKKKKVLKDNLQEGTETYIRNVLVDYVPKHDVAVVQQLFYEGGQFLTVSLKGGSEIVTPTKPNWSPDKSNFISVNDDESDYTENVVVIASCKANKCTKVYSEKTHSGAEKWIDNNTVEFEKRKFDPGTGKSEAQTVKCTIKKKVACS